MEGFLGFLGEHFSFDWIIIPLFLWFYFRAPVQRISDTALLMTAYGRDGETWMKRMLSQYWKPPVYLTAAIAAGFLLLNWIGSPPYSRERYILGAAIYVWFIMIPLWPLVFCIRANRAFYRLEAWRQMQIEHRLAAGLASPADYHGYIQTVKEREYNRGYSDGEFMSMDR